VLLVLVATFGLSACITLIWLGMRAVMDIGGRCAEGGPFVPVQPCPVGAPAALTLGMLGIFGFGALGIWAGAQIGGGGRRCPCWRGRRLFGSLGWNFLEYGFTFEEGAIVWGWVIPGVIFILMAVVPLWFVWSARASSVPINARFGLPAGREAPPNRRRHSAGTRRTPFARSRGRRRRRRRSIGSSGSLSCGGAATSRTTSTSASSRRCCATSSATHDPPELASGRGHRERDRGRPVRGLGIRGPRRLMAHTHVTAAHAARGRLAAVLVIGFAAFVIEVAGAVAANSLALLADAGHLLTDVAGVGLALLAIWFAGRPPTPGRTFGYQRLEILAAVANAVLLFGIATIVLIGAIRRIGDPPEIATGPDACGRARRPCREWPLGVAPARRTANEPECPRCVPRGPRRPLRFGGRDRAAS
jgi:hypothetical protein